MTLISFGLILAFVMNASAAKKVKFVLIIALVCVTHLMLENIASRIAATSNSFSSLLLRP